MAASLPTPTFNSLASRLPSRAQTYPGATATASIQDTFLRAISRNARALRRYDGGAAPTLAYLGRRDALGICLKRGIIPIVTFTQGAATLHAWVQEWSAQRGTETVALTTPATTFNLDDPAKDVTFAGSGVTDLAATSSYDPNALGKARITVP